MSQNEKLIPMEIGRIERFTIYVSPLLPHWPMARPKRRQSPASRGPQPRRRFPLEGRR